MNDADHSASILVVDDTPAHVGMLVETLSHAGCQVREVSHPPGLTLLDVSMQGVDGLETSRRLQAMPSLTELPLIFLSGSHVARAALSAALAEMERQKNRLQQENQYLQQESSSGEVLTLEALERAHIEAILGATPTLDVAAKTLGIDASTLYRKRKTYGIG